MMSLKCRVKNEGSDRGFIAITSVLVIAAVVVSIAITTSMLGIGEGQAGLSATKGEDTLNMVEGCVEDALLKARANNSYTGGSLTRPEGSCAVSISKVANIWTMNVTNGSLSQTVPFDDAPGTDVALNGQYPTGVINWGTGNWFLSGPFGLFTTKSISFSGAGITSAPFTFLTASRLVSIQAYNGGTVASTVTLSCTGQTPAVQSVAVGQLVTISTNWTGTCTTVTFASTNSWDTNFDNLIYQVGTATPAYSRTIQTIFTRAGTGITLTSWREI